MVFLSCSCEKNDPILDILETQYPDWVNLSWVSTDGDNTIYPRLSITINGNEVTVTLKKELYGGDTYFENITYEEMTITGNEFMIGSNMDGTAFLNGTFMINESENRIGLSVDRNPYYDEHNYVLEMN